MSFKNALATIALVIATLAIGVALWAVRKPTASPEASPTPLRISAYSSFTSSWGPGPKIIESFERHCGCRVILEDSGDSGLLLQKLKMGTGSAPDVVIGLDRYQASEGAPLWRDISALSEPVVKTSPGLASPETSHLLPFDWAPIAFVFRKGELEPPRSLDDLLDARFKNAIALEDPRTSTP
ncbi:MAG TPA: thiamine ABC transporter substrate-binding protein, partial [Bdellovibrionales bacterium]|nr:thiamine ABC transporter substrate-binding protein [Bdellovibrionales bacterium]